MKRSFSAFCVLSLIMGTTSGCADHTGITADDVLGVAALGLGVATAAAGAGAFTGGQVLSYDAIGAGVSSALGGAAVLADSYDATTAANLQSFGGGIAAVGNAFSGGSGGSYGSGYGGVSGARYGGGSGGYRGSDAVAEPSSLDVVTAWMGAVTTGVNAVTGGAGGTGYRAGGSSGGLDNAVGGAGNGYSQRGALEDCAELYGYAAGLVPEAQALMAECQRRAGNMGTLGAGPVTGVGRTPPVVAPVYDAPRRSHSGGAVSAK